MTQFEGFEPANTTPVPDVLFDQLLTELTGAELKAMLYIIRRTWGFKKNEDTISLSQFQTGITTREGKVLDKGCGVKDRTTLVKSLNSLEKKGYIKSTKPVNENGEHETTAYAIKFKGEESGSGENLPPHMKRLLGVVGKPDEGSGENGTTPSRENPPTRSRKTRRTINSNTINSKQVSLSPSLNAQDDAVEVSHKVELTPEQKTRARSLKAKIEDRCGKLASGGANINENKAIARLVSGYSDADIDDVQHYLEHCSFKWSKPDFKFKIRGNVLLDEIEGVLRLFQENPSLRNAVGTQKTNSTPAPTSLSHRRLEVPPMAVAAGGAR